MFKKLTFIFMFVLGGIQAHAQLELTETPVSDTLHPDLSKYLPPLYMLIDTAIAHDPQRELYMQQAVMLEHKMKVQNMQWLKEWRIEAMITPIVNFLPQYTTYTIPGTDSTRQRVGLTELNANDNMVGFASSVGFRMSLPIYHWATNKHEIRALEAQSRGELAMVEASRREIAAKVTLLYNNIFAYQRILEINQKAIQMGKMGVQMGEEKFRNGQIELSELAQLYDLMTKYGLDYERSYSAYRSAYRDLETVVGIPLSKFKF